MRISRRQLVVGGAVAAPIGLYLLTRGKSEAPARPTVITRDERDVVRVVESMPTLEGAGVRLRRALGGAALSLLDPFLLLDEFKSDDPDDYAPGFPTHPHRGFETVTYMIEGAMEHKDSIGNQGRLGPGSAQWMTAGHGIVHSEMPKQERGLMWGLQLWVNLPSSHKMIHPRYQDIAPSAIPELERERAKLRVVAGRMFGAEGAVTGIEVMPTMVDVALERGGSLEFELPRDHAAFAYVLDGAMRIGDAGREVRERHLAVLGQGMTCSLRCDAVAGRAILVAARPIGEPVARRGPFVMNTQEELRQAFEDYQTGRLTTGI